MRPARRGAGGQFRAGWRPPSRRRQRARPPRARRARRQTLRLERARGSRRVRRRRPDLRTRPGPPRPIRGLSPAETLWSRLARPGTATKSGSAPTKTKDVVGRLPAANTGRPRPIGRRPHPPGARRTTRPSPASSASRSGSPRGLGETSISPNAGHRSRRSRLGRRRGRRAPRRWPRRCLPGAGSPASRARPRNGRPGSSPVPAAATSPRAPPPRRRDRPGASSWLRMPRSELSALRPISARP